MDLPQEDKDWIDKNVGSEEVDIVNQSFGKRLAYGIETEKRALEKVRKLVDSEAYLVEGLDKGKDIVCPTRNFLIEVKDQRQARIAICVEYARSSDQVNWRLSALSTTKATHWIYFAQDKFFVIETEDFKKLMENKEMKIYPHRQEFYKCKYIYLDELAPNCLRIWSN